MRAHDIPTVASPSAARHARYQDMVPVEVIGHLSDDGSRKQDASLHDCQGGLRWRNKASREEKR
jgi:hypothetical protein